MIRSITWKGLAVYTLVFVVLGGGRGGKGLYLSLPETSKQNLMELVHKTNSDQYCVLKSRQVFLDNCLPYGKWSEFSSLALSTCNET